MAGKKTKREKLYKVAGSIVLLIIVSSTLFIVYGKNSPNTDKKSAVVSNTTASDRNDKLYSDSPEHLSDEEIKDIMQKIDSRVKNVKDRIDRNFNGDHYEGDRLIFRHFENGGEQESFTEYHLYYDEQGKLIYADIAHYRGALYSIYFHNDELLHVEFEGGLSVNGVADVEAVVKKDPSYAFIQEDTSLCLENAYR